MAERLQEGVAPWRDPQEVRRAVIGWVRESLADLGDPDARAFVAERNGEVVGFVCASERSHFTGEVDTYIGDWSWRRTLRGAELDGRWSKPPRTGVAPGGAGGSRWTRARPTGLLVSSMPPSVMRRRTSPSAGRSILRPAIQPRKSASLATRGVEGVRSADRAWPSV